MQNDSEDALPTIERRRALLERGIGELKDQLFANRVNIDAERRVGRTLGTDQSANITAIERSTRELLVRLDAWQEQLDGLTPRETDAPPDA
jgi:hypothetical protein